MLGGMTLLDRARALLQQCCDEVLVAAPAALELSIADEQRVTDVAHYSGPLAGVLAALEARPDREAFVLGVDFPLMRDSTVRAIAAARGDAIVSVPVPGGVPQPLAAAYGPGAGAALARVAGTAPAISRAVLAVGARMIPEEELAKWEGGLEVFLNVNTPDDLAMAERLLK